MEDDTLAIHAGTHESSSLNFPIHQTVSYEFGTSAEASALFQLKQEGNLYTRLTNPTTKLFEEKVSALENGNGAVATASGMSAILFTILNVAINGDNIILSDQIYGGTAALAIHTLKNFGIEVRFFSMSNIDKLNTLINKNTKIILFESISNPNAIIADFNKIVSVADKFGVITCSDNTLAPMLVKPLDHGVDIVVHSATKYMTSHGSSMGGIIIESRKVKEKIIGNNRYRHFETPDKSYHGFIFSKSDFSIFTHRVRYVLLRDMGASLSPFNAWLFLQGLVSMPLRVKQQSKTAYEVANFLSKNSNVNYVYYPKLLGNPNFKLCKLYFKYGCGSVMSIDVGSFKKAKEIVENISLFKHAVSIGNAVSIITHPASTTHSQMTPEELKNNGITAGMLRLSIGLENKDDLIASLKEVL